RQEASPALRKKHLDEAIRMYRLVLEVAPGHPVAGNNLAWLLSHEGGAPAEALVILQRVCQGHYSQQPLSGDRLPLEMLDTLGIPFGAAQRNADAVKLFQEAVRRYKDEPRVYLHLARSYAGLQQYRPALDSLTQASRLATAQAEHAPDPARKAQLL